MVRLRNRQFVSRWPRCATNKAPLLIQRDAFLEASQWTRSCPQEADDSCNTVRRGVVHKLVTSSEIIPDKCLCTRKGITDYLSRYEHVSILQKCSENNIGINVGGRGNERITSHPGRRK